MNEGTSAFAETRWTLVLRAQENDNVGQRALSELCDGYYAPVVSFLRWRYRNGDDARDVAHAFFARLLSGRSLGGANPGRGRFRNYLLGALRNFLADQHDRECADKRGGESERIPMSDTVADSTPAASDEVGIFDRQWALTVIGRALQELQKECAAAGKQTQFEVLKPWLGGSAESLPLGEAAARLGQSEGAAKVAIHRLRRRFREAVKAEIAQTVPAETDVDDELRFLISVLTRAGG